MATKQQVTADDPDFDPRRAIMEEARKKDEWKNFVRTRNLPEHLRSGSSRPRQTDREQMEEIKRRQAEVAKGDSEDRLRQKLRDKYRMSPEYMAKMKANTTNPYNTALNKAKSSLKGS
jgi:hypothetical protein